MRSKVDIFFGLGQDGWQETYWRSGDTGIADALRGAEAMCTDRAALLMPKAAVLALRVSDVDVTLDSLVSSKTFPYSKSYGGAIGPENTFTAVLCRMQAGTLYRKSIYLRGIPKGITFPVDPTDALTNAWMANFFTFAKNFVGTFKWRLNSQLKSGLGLKQPVLSVADSGAPRNLLQFNLGATTIPDGAKILLRGFTTHDFNGVNINGIWQNVALGPSTCGINLPWDPQNNYRGGGSISVRDHVFQNVTEVFPQRLVRRKPGKPYGKPKTRKGKRV